MARHAEELATRAPGPIIDVPCGYGRNAACIASYGAEITCLDRDDLALAAIDTGSRDAEYAGGPLRTLRIDLEEEPWPFAADSVGAIVSVHWPYERLIFEFANTLRAGGYLLIETIGGQGRNHQSLPDRGFLASALEDSFEIRYLKERPVGPESSNAVAAKLLAVRRTPSSGS